MFDKNKEKTFCSKCGEEIKGFRHWCICHEDATIIFVPYVFTAARWVDKELL